MLSRIGMFLVFTSLIILAVFFMSAQQQTYYLSLFCSGMILLVLGVVIMWRGRTPPGESQRFRLLRKSRQDANQQEEGQE